MSQFPRVSIIIPTMNRRDELSATLKSLISPDLGDVEIIVVDDGSTDGAQDVEVGLVDPRIRMIKHPTNLGGCAARNSGIDAAQAPLVAFLDSDDRWLPGKLARQLETASKQPVGAPFILASNVIAQCEGKSEPHNTLAPEPGDDLSIYLMDHSQAVQTSTMLMPTWLARKVRFREGLRRHQDWDFLLRVIQAGAVLIYDREPQAIYNLDPDPSRVSLQPRRLAATLEWYKLAKPLLSRRAMHAFFVRRALSRDGLREPAAALSGLAWLATRSLPDAFALAGCLLREAPRKLQGKA